MMTSKEAQRIIDAHFKNSEAVGVTSWPNSDGSLSLTIFYIVSGDELHYFEYKVTAEDLEGRTEAMCPY